MREIAQITNVGTTTLFRIQNCLRNNDEAALSNSLNPSTTKPAVSTVLTKEEDDMIAERLIFMAKRGFAVSKETLKSIMTLIASDGCPICKSGGKK